MCTHYQLRLHCIPCVNNSCECEFCVKCVCLTRNAWVLRAQQVDVGREIFFAVCLMFLWQNGSIFCQGTGSVQCPQLVSETFLEEKTFVRRHFRKLVFDWKSRKFQPRNHFPLYVVAHTKYSSVETLGSRELLVMSIWRCSAHLQVAWLSNSFFFKCS